MAHNTQWKSQCFIPLPLTQWYLDIAIGRRACPTSIITSSTSFSLLPLFGCHSHRILRIFVQA